MMPFFSYFPRKNHCSYAHILSKKRPFYKNYAALMPIFCQKTFILSRIHCSHVIFFHFSMKNLLSIPYLVKNTSILSKLPYIMGQKSYRMPFFSWYFTKKISALMPIFFKKRKFSKKCFYSHILSEIRPFSQNTLLSCNFSIFSWKTPCCHAHIWSKNVNSVKTTHKKPTIF